MDFIRIIILRNFDRNQHHWVNFRAFSDRSIGFNNLTLGSNQRMEFLGDTVLQERNPTAKLKGVSELDIGFY